MAYFCNKKSHSKSVKIISTIWKSVLQQYRSIAKVNSNPFSKKPKKPHSMNHLSKQILGKKFPEPARHSLQSRCSHTMVTPCTGRLGPICASTAH